VVLHPPILIVLKSRPRDIPGISALPGARPIFEDVCTPRKLAFHNAETELNADLTAKIPLVYSHRTKQGVLRTLRM
jgi:hypothetical protein